MRLVVAIAFGALGILLLCICAGNIVVEWYMDAMWAGGASAFFLAVGLKMWTDYRQESAYKAMLAELADRDA